jgi:hypothetical protein
MSLFFGGARVAQWARSLDLTTHTSLSPIRRGFAPSFANYKKGALDSQLQVIKFTSCFPNGRWFSPGTSTTKTGRHDIAEIFLKVGSKHQKSIKINLILLAIVLSVLLRAFWLPLWYLQSFLVNFSHLKRCKNVLNESNAYTAKPPLKV